MANNAIALQARAPNTNFLGEAVRQNAAVINQMAQQQPAQRQAEQQRQTLALAQSKEDRERSAADITRISKAAEIFRDQLAAAGFGNVEGIRAARDLAVTLAPEYKNVIAPAEVLASDQARYNQAYMTADQLANKRFGTAVVSQVIDPVTNEVKAVNASGMPGASFSQDIPDITGGLRRPTPPMAAPTAATPAPTAGAELPATGDPIEAAAQAIVAGKTPRDPAFVNLSNEQFDQAQQRAREIGAQPNPPLQPMSYSPGGQQPDLANIVQTMMDTGVVSQANVDAMRQAAGPGKDAQLAQILREHNIRIMPDEGMPGARMGGGEYDPARGAAAIQPAQYYPSEYPVTRGKPPMQGPVPGSAIVPLPRVRGQAAAEEGGKQGVRVTTEPQIAAGTKSAEYKVELQQKLPQARSALNLAVKQLDRDIADIDFVLKTPERQMVVGSIEGRLPSAVNMFRSGGQRAQDVQSRLDKIGASSIVKHLQQMKESTPQGTSLFGQVTEYEDRLVKALAGLDQRQGEAVFDNALREYRSVLTDMKQNLPQVFNDTFSPIGVKATLPPSSSQGLAPGPRRLRYNPAKGDFE